MTLRVFFDNRNRGNGSRLRSEARMGSLGATASSVTYIEACNDWGDQFTDLHLHSSYSLKKLLN